MKKYFRIVISTLIVTLGIFCLYFFFELIYMVIFLNWEINAFFDFQMIRIFIINFMIILSTIPALIFQIRVIKYTNNQRMADDASIISTKQNSIKLGKKILFGYIIFGLAIILIAGQILSVTISHHMSEFHDVKYYNYLVSTIFLLLGISIIIDAIKLKETCYNK